MIQSRKAAAKAYRTGGRGNQNTCQNPANRSSILRGLNGTKAACPSVQNGHVITANLGTACKVLSQIELRFARGKELGEFICNRVK